MRIKCKNCRADVDSRHVDLSRNIAKCGQCGEIFNCADQLSEISSSSAFSKNRAEISIPKNFTLEYAQGGLVITRRWFSPQIFGLLFFCVLWNGFMIVWYTIAITQKIWPMAAFGSLHALVGLTVAYATVAGFINQTVISILPGILKIRQLPLPAPGNIDVPAAEISQLYTRQGGAHGRSGMQVDAAVQMNTFAVHMKTFDQKDRVLISGLTEQDHALYIEQQIERYLGIIDTPISGEVPRV